MTHFLIGNIKQPIHLRQMLLGALCAWMLTACIHPYTTYTDTYYVVNQTAEPILLVTGSPITWDTCATANPQRAWYNSCEIAVPAGQTIRIHPITREYKHQDTGDRMNVRQVVGSTLLLVAGSDTIEWKAQKYDYLYGEEWSFYDAEDWISTEDKDKPYCFYHTFIIDQEKIERAKQ